MLIVKNLTAAQLKLVNLLNDHNLSLVCSEGVNFKCWVEDEQGKLIAKRVRKDTAEILQSKGWIESYDRRDSSSKKYYHCLTREAKLKLN